MNIRLIKTEDDYNKALERLETIFDADQNSVVGDEAEILTLLIEHFEKKIHPIDAPDPIEAIKNQNGGIESKTKRFGWIDWWKKPCIRNFEQEEKTNRRHDTSA